jgi:hypothetical protein
VQIFWDGGCIYYYTVAYFKHEEESKHLQILTASSVHEHLVKNVCFLKRVSSGRIVITYCIQGSLDRYRPKATVENKYKRGLGRPTFLKKTYILQQPNYKEVLEVNINTTRSSDRIRSARTSMRSTATSLSAGAAEASKELAPRWRTAQCDG